MSPAAAPPLCAWSPTAAAGHLTPAHPPTAAEGGTSPTVGRNAFKAY